MIEFTAINVEEDGNGITLLLIMTYQLADIIDAHDQYEKFIRSLEDDLRYWDHFVKVWAIPEYQKTHDNHRVFESGYAVYDINVPLKSGWLKSSRDTVLFNSDDLHKHSNAFFGWLYNMALVRAYNGMEILLLRLINTCFLQISNNFAANNKDVRKIFAAVKQQMPGADKKNNQFMLDYLVMKSPEYDSFLSIPIRSDDPTTWRDFFYLISILRHTTVHNSMVITNDEVNAIKSRNCYTTLQNYYDLNSVTGNAFAMHPKQDSFLNLTSLITEFTVNTLKVICKQDSLYFLGLS